MDINKYESGTIRHQNRLLIAKDKECRKAILEMQSVEEFLRDFSFLSTDRDFVLCKGHIFSLRVISTSYELTVGNIISCCESGCIADAYSLLRKYRDDMFFYLYIVVYAACKKMDCKSPTVDEMETNIEQWINNDLCNLHIGTVLQSIGQSHRVRAAVQKYNLKTYFDTIGDKLNNYVHSNGVSFYNQNVCTYQDKSLQKQMKAIMKDMRTITITFLFILALCSPLSLMSTDYVDYMDCDMTPPDRAQYLVAPFVVEFINNNIDLIDESCMQYLQDNILLRFE